MTARCGGGVDDGDEDGAEGERGESALEERWRESDEDGAEGADDWSSSAFGADSFIVAAALFFDFALPAEDEDAPVEGLAGGIGDKQKSVMGETKKNLQPVCAN